MDQPLAYTRRVLVNLVIDGRAVRAAWLGLAATWLEHAPPCAAG
jgi:hypothetical protein